jgi:hypothetical protein
MKTVGGMGSRSDMYFASPTTPTTSTGGFGVPLSTPIRMMWPTGSSEEKNFRAKASLMIATRGAFLASAWVKSRPAMSGIRIVAR